MEIGPELMGNTPYIVQQPENTIQFWYQSLSNERSNLMLEEKAMTKYKKSVDAIAALNSEQFRVTQENGTERPGTGEYLDNREPGIYIDIVSKEPIFNSPFS